SGPERALLRRLAVFAGGWTLEAAEAVGAGPPAHLGRPHHVPLPGGEGTHPEGPLADAALNPSEVLDLLTGLVDKSLVVAETGGGDERYRLLETIRQYAGEKLFQSGEAPAVRDRHLAWGVELVERAHHELSGP